MLTVTAVHPTRECQAVLLLTTTMASKDGAEKKKQAPIEDGSYVLRPLVKNIPLAPEENSKNPQITCVELWGQWYILSRLIG